jgi:hypothetical protein
MENVSDQLEVTAALLKVPTKRKVIVGPTTRRDVLGNRKNILPPLGLEPRTVQPVA